MARKRKTATIVPGSSVSVVESLLAFGDPFTIAWSTDQTGDLWVKASCVSVPSTEGPFAPNADVPIYAWAEQAVVSPQGAPEFALGPTPRWSGGPASCVAQLIKRETPDGSVLTTLAETPFGVTG